VTEEDRFYDLAKAMHQILTELTQGRTEANPARLGAMAVDRLYEEFPDLTDVELYAISQAYGPTEH
jgi:hypothetical protein